MTRFTYGSIIVRLLLFAGFDCQAQIKISGVITEEMRSMLQGIFNGETVIDNSLSANAAGAYGHIICYTGCVCIVSSVGYFSTAKTSDSFSASGLPIYKENLLRMPKFLNTTLTSQSWIC